MRACAGILPALMIALALSFGIPFQASAKLPDGITMSVEVGYDGYVALGQVNPVAVELDNQSDKTNLSGDLVLEYNGVEYVTRLELPAPSRKKLFLYFPCDNWPPILNLIIRARGYSDSFDLTQQYKTMKPGDTSVAVLTTQPGSLGVVNQLPTAALRRDLQTSQHAEITSGSVYVSYFDMDEVDRNPKFFNRAQVIVLADIDYQQVDASLAETLKACAVGGSSIVFSLGLGGPKVNSSPLVDLCPIRVEGTTQVSDLGYFGAKYGIDASESAATLSIGRLKPGAKVLAWAGQHPAVVSSTYGGGTVSALAFDFTAKPFKQNQALAQLFLDTTLQIHNSANVRNLFVHPWSLDTILKRLTEAKPMSPGFVALFLLCYVVLIGPLNFLILSRLKRRTLVWTTIPAIILAFGWFGLNTGYLTRGSSNVTSYIQELHYYPSSDYVPYQTVMLVFTSQRTKYELNVPDRSAFIYSDIPQGVDSIMGGRRVRASTGLLVNNSADPVLSINQGMWTSRSYFYQGNLASQSKVTSDLTAVRKESELSDVEGTFSIDLPFDLYNCYLYAPNFKINLGNINGKGTYSMPDFESNMQGNLNGSNYLAVSRDEVSSLQRENSVAPMGYRDELLLVGFTENIEAMAEFKRPHNEYRLTMAVVHLPYTPKIPTTGKQEISRQHISGGFNFEPQQRYRGGYMGQHVYASNAPKQYLLADDGYIDFTYELAGKISPRSYLHLSLKAYQPDANTLDSSSGNAITNMVPYMDVFIDYNGTWQQVDLNQTDPAIFVPITGAIDDSRKVTVRFKAKAEFALETPMADWTSS